jgi:tRNA dimethylallyltransferase
MFAEGLVAEVQQLLSNGATGQEKPFEAIGYKQVLKYLRGQIPLPEAIESTKIETRQYAKRQWTWFRRDTRVWWLDGFGNDPEIQQIALAKVVDFLPTPAHLPRQTT